MLKEGTEIVVLPNNHYGCQYTGCIGTVVACYSERGDMLVELDECINQLDDTKYLMFYEREVKVKTGDEPRITVKEFVYDSPKLTVLWSDGTKTTVCYEQDNTSNQYAKLSSDILKRMFDKAYRTKFDT